MRKGSKYVLVEYMVNGKYHGANYEQSQVPGLIKAAQEAIKLGNTVTGFSVDEALVDL